MSGSRRRARLRGLFLALALGATTDCSQLGLFDAPLAERCRSDDECHALDTRTGNCTTGACDRVTGRCQWSDGRDSDGDGHQPLHCNNLFGAMPADDCDDTHADVHPGAADGCDGRDVDCSQRIPFVSDEDTDRDGFVGQLAPCTGGLARDDCDDHDARVHPGAIELCNGADDDCDGVVDNASSSDARCAVAAPPGSDVACREGRCVIVACSASMADCDATVATGCETDTRASRQHCGACDHPCGVGATCESGRCTGPVVELAAGEVHTCARRDSGTVVCWGADESGLLGDGDAAGAPGTPVVVTSLSDAVEITAGARHSCARRASRGVVCWGANERGQLGNGSRSAAPAPVEVTALRDATEIAAGGAHTCARRADGGVVCWGSNAFGQLGDGGISDPDTLVAVRGLEDAVEIVSGGAHSCARRRGGSVVCWGHNDAGQLGEGSRIDASSPVVVQGLGDAVELAAGATHTCARRGDGTVMCWGANAEGQLGAGSTESAALLPVAVPGVAGAIELDAGDVHSCARLASGAVVCWGGDASGQLGDGTLAASRNPRGVVGLADAVALSLGSRHGCALRAEHSVVCWGDNSALQLGDGSTRRLGVTPTPVQGL